MKGFNLDKCSIGGYDELLAWMMLSKDFTIEKTYTTTHGYMEYSQFFERGDGTYRIDWIYDPCGNDNKGERTLVEGPVKQTANFCR